ncbi:MAG TPA: thermonuclease family protein [Sphingomicrobium sp.]|nr:thermonuclease family protein [Sphingomicrobium sp.]
MRRRNKSRVILGGQRNWSKQGAYQRRRSRGRRTSDDIGSGGGGWLRFAPLWLGAIFVGLVVGGGANWSADALGSGSSEGGVRASFGFCHTGGGTNCVVDGDTLYVQGVKIRIADIDAPETHEPKCPEEKSLGDRATKRLISLVNSGEVTLAPIDRDEDSYGRKLRIVKVDGVSVGETLVDDGLARWYRGGRRPWC